MSRPVKRWEWDRPGHMIEHQPIIPFSIHCNPAPLHRSEGGKRTAGKQQAFLADVPTFLNIEKGWHVADVPTSAQGGDVPTFC